MSSVADASRCVASHRSAAFITENVRASTRSAVSLSATARRQASRALSGAASGRSGQDRSVQRGRGATVSGGTTGGSVRSPWWTRVSWIAQRSERATSSASSRGLSAWARSTSSCVISCARSQVSASDQVGRARPRRSARLPSACSTSQITSACLGAGVMATTSLPRCSAARCRSSVTNLRSSCVSCSTSSWLIQGLREARTWSWRSQRRSSAGRCDGISRRRSW